MGLVFATPCYRERWLLRRGRPPSRGRSYLGGIAPAVLRGLASPIHRSAWKGNSAKFPCSILHRFRPSERRNRTYPGPMHPSRYYMLWPWIDMRGSGCLGTCQSKAYRIRISKIPHSDFAEHSSLLKNPTRERLWALGSAPEPPNGRLWSRIEGHERASGSFSTGCGLPTASLMRNDPLATARRVYRGAIRA